MLNSPAAVYLLIAIVFEVVATSALKSSESFTKLVPTVVVALGYLGAFWFLSLTLKTMPCWRAITSLAQSDGSPCVQQLCHAAPAVR